MSRLLAGIVAIALIGVVNADHGSIAASAGRSSIAASAGRARATVPALKVSSRLKRVLRAEISTLRAEQPSAPRILPVPLNPPPDRGVPCFVSGLSRCSDVPCR